MLRAAAWTGGLFAAGGTLCQLFPQTWVEPVVLMALGAALLVVSGRGGAGASPSATAPSGSKQAA
jgi:hypothetical protein